MTNTTVAKWRALIAVQEKCGMTVCAFAESRGITPTTMYWWRSRLHRQVASPVTLALVQAAGQGSGTVDRCRTMASILCSHARLLLRPGRFSSLLYVPKSVPRALPLVR
jgi:hypothetical protein